MTSEAHNGTLCNPFHMSHTGDMQATRKNDTPVTM